MGGIWQVGWYGRREDSISWNLSLTQSRVSRVYEIEQNFTFMFRTTSIKPLSDFVRNTEAHIEHLKFTHEPQILTVNGEAAIVVQDAASYEKMAALAGQARQDAKLQAAMEYFRKGGDGIKAEDVFAKLEAKYL